MIVLQPGYSADSVTPVRLCKPLNVSLYPRPSPKCHLRLWASTDVEEDIRHSCCNEVHRLSLLHYVHGCIGVKLRFHPHCCECHVPPGCIFVSPGRYYTFIMTGCAARSRCQACTNVLMIHVEMLQLLSESYPETSHIYSLVVSQHS